TTPPNISASPDQVADEDTPLIGIPFTVRDAETPADQLRFSTKFLFPDGFLNSGSVVIGGNGTNRWLSVFPPPDMFGTGSVAVIVNDAGGLSASTTFRVEVRSVHDPTWLARLPALGRMNGTAL